jgi:hypothetical protein
VRPVLVIVLCIVSAALGAGIDHYWNDLTSLAAGDGGKPRPVAPESRSTAAIPGRDEVLGDRVRCDVRYQELKLQPSEYRAFFDHCMGSPTGENNRNESREPAPGRLGTSPSP